MLSTPTPARPITRSFEALASRAASTWTAERTSKASAVSSSFARLPFNWSGVMTVQSGSRNRFTADEDIFSAITIFMSMIPLQESYSSQTLHGTASPTLDSVCKYIPGENYEAINGCFVDGCGCYWRWMRLLKPCNHSTDTRHHAHHRTA